MIRAMYAEHYDLYVLQCSAADVGHKGCRRDRLYCILAHKVRTRLVFQPRELYSKIAGVISANVATTPKDYFVATKTDIRLEAARLADQRGVPLHLAAAPQIEF